MDSIIKRVVEDKKLGNDSIILMHNGAKYIPEALEPMIIALLDKSYELGAGFEDDL